MDVLASEAIAAGVFDFPDSSVLSLVPTKIPRCKIPCRAVPQNLAFGRIRPGASFAVIFLFSIQAVPCSCWTTVLP